MGFKEIDPPLSPTVYQRICNRNPKFWVGDAHGNDAEQVLRRIRNEKRPSAPEPSQTPGLSMGRRLFIPNPITTQSIVWKALMGYGLRKS
jgi:hypothetical protein